MPTIDASSLFAPPPRSDALPRHVFGSTTGASSCASSSEPSDLHYTERYAELLTCGKHEYFLSRQEYNKSSYSTVARTRPAGSTSAWRPAKMLLPPALKMSAGATFVCVDHTLVAIGNGEGGKTHREQLANVL